MIIIPVKEGEQIDRALKRFKKKFLRTGTMKQLRSRKQFTKKSVILREQKLKAAYSQKLLQMTQEKNHELHRMDMQFPLEKLILTF